MSKENEELRRIFDRRLSEAGESVLYGKVTATDEAARTCTVEIDDIPYENVLLYAIEKPDLKGFVFIPAVDSQVLVKRIGDDRYCVELFSVIDKALLTVGEKVTAALDAETLSYKNDKVSLTITGAKVELTADEIVFNGGGLGGLVKIQELKDSLDSLKTFTEEMHTAIPAAIAAVGAAMAANGALGKTSYDGAMAGKSITIADMENPKIKH